MTRYGGAVAACGLAAGMDLPTSVAPFILRGVSLLGIDSVMAPIAAAREAWARLAADLDRAKLAAMTRTIGSTRSRRPAATSSTARCAAGWWSRSGEAPLSSRTAQSAEPGPFAGRGAFSCGRSRRARLRRLAGMTSAECAIASACCARLNSGLILAEDFGGIR